MGIFDTGCKITEQYNIDNIVGECLNPRYNPFPATDKATHGWVVSQGQDMHPPAGQHNIQEGNPKTQML